MKQNAKSAIFTRENGKRLLRQLLLLLPAWIVLALGIAMCVFSGVGSDTNTSFQQGLGRMLGLQSAAPAPRSGGGRSASRRNHIGRGCGGRHCPPPPRAGSGRLLS